MLIKDAHLVDCLIQQQQASGFSAVLKKAS